MEINNKFKRVATLNPQNFQETIENYNFKREDGYAKTIAKRFIKNKVASVSLILFVIIILTAIFAPQIAPYSPNETQGYFESAPDSDYLLGTDEVGRDVLSRLIYGSRVSLIVGVGSVFIYVLIGTVLGLISGYFGGVIDSSIMRITEVFMSFPYFMVILVLVSLIGPSMWTVTFVLGLLSWPPLCRLIRGQVLTIKGLDFIQAAIATGYSTTSILFRHILPNVLSIIFVNATFGIANAILTEASLSFLGMGVRPPSASWGNMLSNAQSLTVLSREPWRWVPAGFMILISVLAVNFIGDGLRDAVEGETK
nr:oligopeptide ABC transporter permease [Sedimentibacter sp.]